MREASGCCRAGGVALLLRAYFAAAIGTGLLFAFRRFVPWAYAGLVLVNGLKLAVMLLDYRLRMNQHYMGFFATFAYLLVPGKRDALRVLITLFYFWAGMLKLNWEWISGAGLYRPMWPFSGPGVIVACVYVIVLELGVAWGLLAKRAWIFWAAFAQFLVFHALSWQVVGFFYPLLMFAILAIFPLSRLVAPRDPPEGLWRRSSEGEVRSVYALAALFSVLQLIPYAFPGDRALTGQGRLYALHMFDARATLRGVGRSAQRRRHHDAPRSEIAARHAYRVRPDRLLQPGPESVPTARRQARRVRRISISFLSARRSSEGELRRVIDTKGFCAKRERYDPFRHNAWILTE